MAKNEVAVVEEAKLPISAEMAEMLVEDQGQGSENFKSSDLMIPYISILQSLSPQVDKRDGAYVEGAEVGMFFNNATESIYPGDDGIVLIPISYMKRFPEWNPRNKGGGLVKDHGDNESVMERTTKDEKTGRDVTPEGTEIIPTGTHFVFVVDPESGLFYPAVVALSGTQLKKSRRWNSLIANLKIPHPSGQGMLTPASFYQSYMATSVPEQNDKGKWMGWSIKSYKPVLELPNGKEIYIAAREFRKSVAEGRVQVQTPAPEAAGDMDKPAF